MMWLVIFTIVSVALGLGYTLLVRRQSRESLWEWYHSLASTFISFLLAIVTGFWLFDAQVVETDRGDKSKLKQVLQQEIADMKKVLEDTNRATITLMDERRDVLLTYLQPLAVESAAQSGLFNPAETANLLQFAREVRTYNLEVQMLFASLSGPLNIPHGPAVFAIDNIEATRKALLSHINSISDEMAIPIDNEEGN